MRRLYHQLYLTIIASLVLVVLVAGSLWRFAPSETPAECSPESIAAVHGLSASRLKQLICGDLDAIVLMAIRKEPELRYHSAKHFCEDLRRFANCMPVQAQPDSWIYRSQKFIRRHPAAVAAGVGQPLPSHRPP